MSVEALRKIDSAVLAYLAAVGDLATTGKMLIERIEEYQAEVPTELVPWLNDVAQIVWRATPPRRPMTLAEWREWAGQ